MTNEERHRGLLEIANTPICDLNAYKVAAKQINAMIESARKVFGGISTEAQFAEFTAQASSNLTGNEIILLAQYLNRFLFAGPLVDGGRTALRKDVTVAELAYLKRAVDSLQVNFQISATALGMMRMFTGRAAGAAGFWGMTPADMEKELAAIAPQAGMVDDIKKTLAAIAAAAEANGAKLDALQGTANETQAEAAGAKVAAEGAQNGVSFLVHDRMGKQAANSKRGKESREKAVRDDAERQRAERDLETALKRVADDPNVKAGKHGAIRAACRRECSHFTPLTGAKKNGRAYLSLTKADGKPLKPETLARYYRERHGGTLGKE